MESPSALFSTYPVCAHLPIPTGNEATVDVHFIPAQLVHTKFMRYMWCGMASSELLLFLWSFHEYLAVCSSINVVYRYSPTSYVPSSRNRGHGTILEDELRIEMSSVNPRRGGTRPWVFRVMVVARH